MFLYSTLAAGCLSNEAMSVVSQAQYDIMDSYHSLPKRASMSRKLLQPDSDDDEEEEDEEGTVSQGVACLIPSPK